MVDPMKLTFGPYQIYRRNVKSIDDFIQLTNLSYGLAQQLLFKYPKDQLPKLPQIPKREQTSFSEADLEDAIVEEKCAWISCSEYSKRSQLPLETVVQEAASGRLGPVQKEPHTMEDLVIWPAEMQSRPLSELPKYPLKAYSVAFKVLVPLPLDPKDAHDFEAVQRTFLSLAHSLGQPDEVAERAGEVLYRGGFLLQWIAFEVFLRSTVHELLKRHPAKIAAGNRGVKYSLNYQDLLEMSRGLTSIEALRDSLVQREISQQESGGESVHGLINFIKSEFNFEVDPYEAWYIWDGQKTTTSFGELMEFKDVRNALTHDGGTPFEAFFVRYPNVQRRDSAIAIDEDYYRREALVLNSIAHSVAKSIDEGKYRVLSMERGRRG